MKYATVFDLIADVFRKADVKCVLIGGFAVNHYNVTRNTIDIDFLCTKNDFYKVQVLLKNEGYKKIEEKEIFARLKGNFPYIMDIDFMFVDLDVKEKILAEGEEVEISRQKFIVPSVKHIIALKLHSIKNNSLRKLKDMLDIIDLARKNKIDIKGQEFKNICLKYGTEDLYREIIRFG